MTTTIFQGGRRLRGARASFFALVTATLTACNSLPPPEDEALADNLTEMQIRIRLLQTELALLRSTLSDAEEAQTRRRDQDVVLEDRLESLQAQIQALPNELSGLCPEVPAAATLNAQCGAIPEAERVVVSGDKLVVGEVERVWIDPPSAFLDARIDAGAEMSALDVADVVEFERDGNKWVRFDLVVGEETVNVESPLKRYVRRPGADTANAARRPVVDLRVQLGDVREVVEVTLTNLQSPQNLMLGRNFLTDVALVDVARQHVQPAFKAPE